MKVNQVLSLSCDFLGLDEVKKYIDSGEGTELEKNKLNKLVNCLNSAYEEAVTEFLPIFVHEFFETKDGQIKFSQFAYPLSSIHSVKDVYGRKIKHTICADSVFVNAKRVWVCYQTQPEILNKDDEKSVMISERILSYGTTREYLFLQGQSDEALLFHKRFVRGLEKLARKRCLINLPKRRWQ